ncbi:MAG: hypothetical protein KME67_19200, partial [Candidatus Thiodiazotropha sp. (ex Codakia orbicularis)]|nr:hypothetical protein [Candidatus Thiodiazotropha sp. (ex Codakia orbicularis)]
FIVYQITCMKGFFLQPQRLVKGQSAQHFVSLARFVRHLHCAPFFELLDYEPWPKENVMVCTLGYTSTAMT